MDGWLLALRGGYWYIGGAHGGEKEGSGCSVRVFGLCQVSCILCPWHNYHIEIKTGDRLYHDLTGELKVPAVPTVYLLAARSACCLRCLVSLAAVLAGCITTLLLIALTPLLGFVGATTFEFLLCLLVCWAVLFAMPGADNLPIHYCYTRCQCDFRRLLIM